MTAPKPLTEEEVALIETRAKVLAGGIIHGTMAQAVLGESVPALVRDLRAARKALRGMVRAADVHKEWCINVEDARAALPEE